MTSAHQGPYAAVIIFAVRVPFPDAKRPIDTCGSCGAGYSGAVGGLS
jgi:hypothetical protein